MMPSDLERLVYLKDFRHAAILAEANQWRLLRAQNDTDRPAERNFVSAWHKAEQMALSLLAAIDMNLHQRLVVDVWRHLSR
jgi:hypothetical protein